MKIHVQEIHDRSYLNRRRHVDAFEVADKHRQSAYALINGSRHNQKLSGSESHYGIAAKENYKSRSCTAESGYGMERKRKLINGT
jgi:hypothetical protein